MFICFIFVLKYLLFFYYSGKNKVKIVKGDLREEDDPPIGFPPHKTIGCKYVNLFVSF